MRALGAVFFVAVCAYLGSGIFGGLRREGQSARVLPATVTESCRLQGVALRREVKVSSPKEDDALLYGLSAGARLPADTVRALWSEEGAPVESALYFPDRDGLESLSPEMLHALSPEGLRELLSLEERRGEKEGGRLVYDRVWYFAAFSEGDYLPAEGERCRVFFEEAGLYAEGRALYVLPGEKGEDMLILRLSFGDDELMSLRHCTARLDFSEYTGLKIPKDAVHTDSEGNKFVYTLTAGLKESCAVDIIYEGGDFYLAAPAEASAALRAGSRVLLG